MSQMISRRKILVGAVKTGVGLTALRGFNAESIIAFSQVAQTTPDRYQAAYKRLDEYVARHMAEVGAPGMTLALASRNGLLRADFEAGLNVGESIF